MGKATQAAAGKKRIRVISPEEKVRRRAYALARRAANLEELRRKDREAYYANREKLLEESKARQRVRRANMTEADMVKQRAYFRERYHEKWASDRVFKMRIILRSRLRGALKNRRRIASSVRDLGCTIEHLIQHIESQFKDGWSWENWGPVWHVDHHYPMAAANLEDKAEFLAVNNWRNLRPMAGDENVSKHATVTDESRHLFLSMVAEFTAQQVA